MSGSEHNPWDQTIWDPLDPEQAIEDPMHGPSAINDMLQIPAMPIGDGTYYQPGAYYTTGTAYQNPEGEPIIKINDFLASINEPIMLQEWVTTYYGGGETALIELEARRQRERVAATQLAYCFRLNDVCPGGKQLGDCAVGKEAFEASEKRASEIAQNKPRRDEGIKREILLYASKNCIECGYGCESVVQTHDGVPQLSMARFFARSLEPDLVLDLTDVTMSPMSLDDLKRHVQS